MSSVFVLGDDEIICVDPMNEYFDMDEWNLDPNDSKGLIREKGEFNKRVMINNISAWKISSLNEYSVQIRLGYRRFFKISGRRRMPMAEKVDNANPELVKSSWRVGNHVPWSDANIATKAGISRVNIGLSLYDFSIVSATATCNLKFT